MTMRIPPPLLALAAAGAQRALDRDAPGPTPARGTAAAALGLASVALTGAALTRFHRTGTTVDPFEPRRATSLVTTGANGLTRNPMYLGMAGALAAHAVYRGSWRALVPLAGFVAVIDRFQIAFEEPALRERFGVEYDEYCAAVPRWVDRGSLSRRAWRAVLDSLR